MELTSLNGKEVFWKAEPRLSLDARPIILAHNRGVAWVDAADIELCGRNWHLHGPKKTANYAATNVRVGKRKTIATLHAMVARRIGLSAQAIDHKDRNGLNCTRANLRAAADRQNHGNVGKYKNNASGYKGVYFNRARGLWVAQISIARGVNRNIAAFNDPEKSARVYDAWARETFGEFACLNFPEYWV